MQTNEKFEDWFGNQLSQIWITYFKVENGHSRQHDLEIPLGSIEKPLKEAFEGSAETIFKELDKNNTGYGDIVISKEEYQKLKLAFLPNLKVGVSSEVA